MIRLIFLVALSFGLSACGSPTAGNSTNTANTVTNRAASCVANNPALAFGAGLHAPSANPLPAPASNGNVISDSRCNGNQQFLFGAAKADITGPAGGKIHMGNESPDNYSTGIHIRQYSRSFIVVSPCNGQRVVMGLTDTGMLFESVRQAVLDLIAADPILAPLYRPENVMLSATHTHSTPGGQAHFTAYNALRGGHETQAFAITVEGLFKSIQQAHANLAASPDPGKILINHGELLGATKNRAEPAYGFNGEAERAEYLDINGGEINTSRLMTLLKFQRDDDTEVGSINWFAVHPTSDALSEYGLGGIPISGDNKGYASYLFERFKAADAPNDSEAFVSSFMQADEGDIFTQLYFDNDDLRAEKDADLPANEPSPVTVANGLAQLNRALSLYDNANQPLSGPVDYRFGYVQMDAVTVSDPVVLASLNHPASMDADPKRTCSASMGISFPAAGHGAQPGEQGLFTPAGVNCSDPDAADAVIQDFMNGAGGNAPAFTFAYAVGCNFQNVPPLSGVDLSCQADKPVLFVFGPPVNASANILPFQIFRIGNLAILGLPWEITTMAGRRLRDTLLDVLKVDGVDFAVITGLANDYVSYLTTREEYALQMYEAASNQFGPWSLAAVQQETRRLAIDMVTGAATIPGPTPPRTSPDLIQTLPPQGGDQAPPGSSFGAIVTQSADEYAPGDTVRVVFQASGPNSDLKTNGSFLFIEQQDSNGDWQTIAIDADPETSFVWQSDSFEPQFNASTTSTAEILWRIPRNQPPGNYRIRFEGVANQASVLTDYAGKSQEFIIAGPVSACP